MKSPTEHVLSLHKVTKRYGAKLAVDSASFTVERGEIFGFLGPNGAGKTTTIRMILDSLRPTSGDIAVLGLPSTHAKPIHQRVGYLSGDMEIDGDLTGGQYLAFVDGVYGGGRQARIAELVKLLDANTKDRIDQLSRGNRQKIGLIAALLHEPELLILDEPTSGFDPLVQEEFLHLLTDYRERGGTVFMSSHILSEVQKVCDRVAFIKNGRIERIERVGDFANASQKRVEVSAGAGELGKLRHEHTRLKGLTLTRGQGDRLYSYQGPVAQLLAFLSRYDLTDIRIGEPELEDVFLSYYEDGKDES